MVLSWIYLRLRALVLLVAVATERTKTFAEAKSLVEVEAVSSVTFIEAVSVLAIRLMTPRVVVPSSADAFKFLIRQLEYCDLVFL